MNGTEVLTKDAHVIAKLFIAFEVVGLILAVPLIGYTIWVIFFRARR